jgi:putative transposase
MELESGPQKDGQMKRARFSEEQIIAVLKEHEAGAKTADPARKHGISEATIYNWKAKFGGMDVSEAKRLKALEEENAKLKKLLMLDQDGSGKGEKYLACERPAIGSGPLSPAGLTMMGFAHLRS